jgi:DNA-binding SARP family transcriptional activator/tetratricopeptide (TPR) repeat protein
MDVCVLGPVEVSVEGRPVAIGAGKPRALLALLALNAGSTIAGERLIDGLWGEEPPATAAKMVQVYVSQLRRALAAAGDGAEIVTRGRGYELRLGSGEVDAHRFERLVARGAPREALALWRGSPLDDVAEEPFAAAEIRRLEELRLAAFELAIEHDLAAGRHRQVIGELEGLVREEPLRERLHAQRMLALYRSGRQADALEAYRDARAALVEEIGVEPGPDLRRLHEAILRQDAALDPPGEPTDGASDPQATRQPSAEPPRSAFVGRERELAELIAGLDDAFAGRGRLFLLVGEPGIGKSRLSDELIAHARTRGARVLVGRCWEAGGAPAYWPWVQSLRAYVRETDSEALRAQLGAGAADLGQIVPELRARFPDLPELGSPGSEDARFRLFDATAQFLRNASARRPIVLVLDDLQAADTPSLLLVQFLARELGSTRMLLVGAYRDVDPVPGEPLTEMLAEVTREPVTRRLSLAGLNEGEVTEYVELTSPEIASAELLNALQEETEGNPLFVGELVRLLSAEGVRSDPVDGVRLAIPETIHDVIARRLAHLSRECMRVLGRASVVGREFALDVLARACDVSEDELLDTLDQAMAARVVSDVPGASGRLRFAHVLFRDTLYDALTATRRIRLHREAIEALEALYGSEPGPHLAELAHHSMLGSEHAKGVRYATAAGDRALGLLAYEEASRLYATALRALELSRPQDETAQCQLLLALGEADARAGSSTAAKQAFLDAAGLARRLGLARELARAAAGYGGRIVWVRAGTDDHLVPLLEEGLAALPEGDLELRARLLARLAGALRDDRSRERRDAVSREAIALARRAGNLDVLAYALSARGHAIIAPDTVEECLALGDELREVAARSGDSERVAAGWSLRTMAKLFRGDVRETERDLATARRIADELRQPAQLWDIYAAQAMVALATGRFDEAEELMPQALALGERAVPEAAIPIFQFHRYTLFDFRGGLEQVERSLHDVVAQHPTRVLFRCALAHADARLGSVADARQALDDLTRDDCSALPFDQEWLCGMSLLGETASLVGDAGSAAVIYRLLTPWAAFNAADTAEGIRGSVSRYLALLATTLNRFDAAERHFEDAVAMNARMGLRPWLARTQDDYARMLLARDDPGDHERVQQLVATALASYRELGMEAYAASASALAQEVGVTE